jgi:hypothetical protein
MQQAATSNKQQAAARQQATSNKEQATSHHIHIIFICM